jgi:hypothetical protein
MSNTTKKEKVYSFVQEILESKPETRDNDMYLAAIVWYRQCGNRYDRNDVSFTDFLHILRNYKKEGILTFETISRVRRKIQEKFVHLRGEEYDKRHAKQQEVKEDLRAMDFKLDAQSVDMPDETLLNGQQTLRFNG